MDVLVDQLGFEPTASKRVVLQGRAGDDPANNWHWTEQWLPHAAWFLVAGSWQAAR